MYKRLLLACLAACSVQAATAQSLPSMKPVFGQVPVKPQGKTTAYHERLAARAYFSYDPSASLVVLNDTTVYSYVGDHTGGVATQQFDTSVYMTSVPPNILNSERTMRTYDAENNIVTELKETWDYASSSWRNSLLLKHSYVTGNVPASDSAFIWDVVAADWMPYYNNEYVYNTGAQLISQQYNVYNTGSFEPYSETSYTYDANGNVMDAIYRTWNGVAMQNVSRHAYMYTSSNIMYRGLNQAWNNLNNMWVNAGGIYKMLNSSDTVEKTYDLIWNEPGSYFDTAQRVVYTYNAALLKADETTQSYDVATETYTNVKRRTNTFNDNNNLYFYYTETWNGSTWGMTSDDRKELYYWEEYTPSAVAQLKQQGGKLQVYPIPANNTLNIDVRWDATQNYTLTIADMQGRVVLQSDNNNAGQVLDISALPAGAYNIVLKGAKGGLQHSKFTVVR